MYQLTHGQTIIRLSDNASIPNDPKNSDYARYLIWIKEGNIPEPADLIPEPTYAELRTAEYPSIPDQLDLIYWVGLEGWKAKIKKTKDKYPKP